MADVEARAGSGPAGRRGTVVLATCAQLPDGDEDAAQLDAALQDQGVESRWQVWDDGANRWSDSPVVLRSTWDYTARHTQFLDWARGVPQLINSVSMIEWNSDKIYLADLDAAGVPVVPTSFVTPEQPADAGGAPSFPTDVEFVIKPSVGAGSLGAGRFGPDDHDAARSHVEALRRAGRTVLVQPYLTEVDEHGETALIHVDGRFSHAVRKAPLLPPGTVHGIERTGFYSEAEPGSDLFVPERITPREPSADELALAERVLAVVGDRFGETPLYARVDLLPTADGPRLIELELVEPSLFLSHADGAVQRFAAAVAARVLG